MKKCSDDWSLIVQQRVHCLTIQYCFNVCCCPIDQASNQVNQLVPFCHVMLHQSALGEIWLHQGLYSGYKYLVGGAAGGMPDISQLLQDPEILSAFSVSYYIKVKIITHH